MKRMYDRLSIEEFGKHLLESQDLDPIYVALHAMKMDQVKLSKWLVSYWCLYHAGTACFMSDLDKAAYWPALMTAARNVTETPIGGRWPRGHERRHFRGQQGIDAVNSLMARHPAGPADMVAGFPALIHAKGEAIPFELVKNRAQEERGFGPWIAFKIADMVDRLGIAPVNFDQAAVFMFKDPREAALRLWRTKCGLADNAVPVRGEDFVINEVVTYLIDHFKDYTAPPRHERPVSLQEIETILCKWKSHQNGHYPLFNDVDEIRSGLAAWRQVSPTAAYMLECMPKGGPNAQA